MADKLDVEYKEMLLKAMEYHFPGAKVILFGSRARGTHKPASDIDLAVDTGKPVKLREVARARVTLEHLPIPLKIDIVDMHNIPVELKDVITREGVVWKG
jgi:predicted nucleotidyltransferase